MKIGHQITKEFASLFLTLALLTINCTVLGATETSAKIGYYEVKPISNKLYTDNCKGTKY